MILQRELLHLPLSLFFFSFQILITLIDCYAFGIVQPIVQETLLLISSFQGGFKIDYCLDAIGIHIVCYGWSICHCWIVLGGLFVILSILPLSFLLTIPAFVLFVIETLFQLILFMMIRILSFLFLIVSILVIFIACLYLI
jgi:hypothetical protein